MSSCPGANATPNENDLEGIVLSQLSGPYTYQITFDREDGTNKVNDCRGKSKFSAPVTHRRPKLYVVSNEGEPIYVGATIQPIANRLRQGFTAKGEHGYYGYAWGQGLDQVTIDIWVGRGGDEGSAFIETLESEVVFLIRKEIGQWPAHQTEIHFHPSDPVHRELAAQIVKRYRSP